MLSTCSLLQKRQRTSEQLCSHIIFSAQFKHCLAAIWKLHITSKAKILEKTRLSSHYHVGTNECSALFFWVSPFLVDHVFSLSIRKPVGLSEPLSNNFESLIHPPIQSPAQQKPPACSVILQNSNRWSPDLYMYCSHEYQEKEERMWRNGIVPKHPMKSYILSDDITDTSLNCLLCPCVICGMQVPWAERNLIYGII